MRQHVIIISFLLPLFFTANVFSKTVWSDSELNTIESLALNNLKTKPDPSNSVLTNTKAIKLGKALFNEPLISHNKKVACASCHIKEHSFTDNKLVATGVRKGIRNTPTLLNVSQQNWFFWDGRKDSLWAQPLSSLENPAEHNFTRTEMFHFIYSNPSYKEQYETIFKQHFPSFKVSEIPTVAGPNGNLSALKAWKKLSRIQKYNINTVFTNIGKTIASYVATIKSKPTRFDRFTQALLTTGSSDILDQTEQRGLKLFINQKTGCINCHSSPIFSNKGFHNIGTGIRAKDNGRSEVIDAVIHDPFNCLGKYSNAKADECLELRYAKKDRHALAGSFKVPTLRSISKTAPYMHDGRYKNLEEVLEHYSSITKDKDIETDLPEINLSPNERSDLIKFLLTL